MQAFHWLWWWQQHGLKARLSKPIETSMWQGKLCQAPVITHSCSKILSFDGKCFTFTYIYDPKNMTILTSLWMRKKTVEGITIVSRCHMSHQAKSPNAMVPVATRPKTFEACPKKNRETPRPQEENTTAIRKSKNTDHNFPHHLGK